MASPSADQHGPSSPTTERTRSAAIAVVVVLLAAVAGIAAYFVLGDANGGAGTPSSEGVLVLLDGEEMHHVGDDGEVTASFELGLDTDRMQSRVVIGSHIAAKIDDEVIIIDAADGEVHRFDYPADSSLIPTGIAGQTSLVVVGSYSGRNVLDVIDLRDGRRHHLGSDDDSLFLPEMVRASPDGSLVGVTDLREGGDTPTVLLSLAEGDRINLPGYLAGISQDRAVTSEAQPGTPSLTLRWFDHSGEETWQTTVEEPDYAVTTPEGSVVYATDASLHRLEEGDESPTVLDGPELESDARGLLLPVGSEGQMILLGGDQTLLIDSDAQTLASGPTPEPWQFDGTRALQRCVSLGHMGQPGLVFDVEEGSTLTDGTVRVFAQSAADGCTLVTGQDVDDGAEYTVTGADVVHVVEPNVGVSGVFENGRVVVRSVDGIFLLPADAEGERTKVWDEPVWHRLIALGS